MRKLDISEALRYLGARGDISAAWRDRASAVGDRLEKTVPPRWTWRLFPLERTRDGFLLGTSSGALKLTGHTAETMLSDCHSAVLLACTLGAAFDTMLRTAQSRDMAEAVILDACGNAWVEAGCDGAEAEISARFPEQYLTDRFSPGYGDLSLTYQREICTLLDTPRRLGVHVTDSLLMNPAKSVTAVIGISERPQMARVRGCGHCAMRETCTLRRGGGSCGI